MRDNYSSFVKSSSNISVDITEKTNINNRN